MGETLTSLVPPEVIQVNPDSKTPISREAYFIQLHLQMDYCQDQITMFENKIAEIRGIIKRIEEKEALGMRMSFYEEAGGLSNEAAEKPPLGFTRGAK